MANNSINWMGNKVVQTALDSIPTQLPMMPYDQPPYEPYLQQQRQIPPDQQPSQQMPGQQQTQPPITTPPEQVPTPITPPSFIQGPPPVMDIDYIPGYLRSLIGKNVRAEFIIGSSQYSDRTGVMTKVGVNYFVLHDVNSRTDIMCDLYSVKFVTTIVG